VLPDGLSRICPAERAPFRNLITVTVSDLLSRRYHRTKLIADKLIISVEQRFERTPPVLVERSDEGEQLLWGRAKSCA
jgi:hypothetical protein